MFVIITRSVLLGMSNVSDRSCRGNQNTHFVFNNFFFEKSAVCVIMWKNIVQRCGPQMATIWRMPIACCKTKVTHKHIYTYTHIHMHIHTHIHTYTHTYTYTQTHTQYVTPFVTPLQKWLQGSAPTLRYTYSTVQYSTVQYITVQHSTIQYSTVQYSTIQYSTVQYSTIEYSTVQYNTVQYSTIQYSTVQYSTIVLCYRQVKQSRYRPGVAQRVPEC